MKEIISFIETHWDEILAVIGGIISTASIIVKLTPTTKDDKILKYIIFVLSAMSIHSCSYDYEMPDLSNAAPTYSVGGVSEELRQVLIEDAKEYGLTFEYSAEHWRTIVKEKDEKGNILYEGEPRGIADKNANTLQVSYVCSCRRIRGQVLILVCLVNFQSSGKGSNSSREQVGSLV